MKEQTELMKKLEGFLKGEPLSQEDVKQAIQVIRVAEDIVENYLPIIEASRPLILNGERLRDFARHYRGNV